MRHPRSRQVSVQLTPDLAARVARIRATSAVPPTESAVVRACVEQGLPAVERAAGVAESSTKKKAPRAAATAEEQVTAESKGESR